MKGLVLIDFQGHTRYLVVANRTVKVELGNRSYSILVGDGLLASIGRRCRSLRLGKRCVVITDSVVGPLYGEEVMSSLVKAGFEPALVSIPSGEASKRLKVVESCFDQLAAHRLERSSFIVALGGGVVGDLAGFVAATYLRGIDFVQVPTTLLAQVDSSVGGKTGVNLAAGKNLVGAFYQPKLVLCDLATLASLPEREYRSGLAEVIKYGIIYDAPLFKKLERDIGKLLLLDSKVLGPVISRCCRIKADVVALDEKEGGLRAILNFGHTIGHAIEATAGYGKYLHGEAIAIGQVLAARLSEPLSGLNPKDSQRIKTLLEHAGLPVDMNVTPKKGERLHAAMALDKKVAQGQVKFVLAQSIGCVKHGVPVDRETIDQICFS